MSTITIKNIPEELYTRLKQLAETNRRSINSEIIMCIEHAVYSEALDPAVALTRARRLRQATADHPITDEELTAAKIEGRR